MMATPGQKIWKIRMRKCIFHFIFGVKLEKIDLWNPNEELRFSIEEVYRAGRFGEKNAREEYNNSTKHRPSF